MVSDERDRNLSSYRFLNLALSIFHRNEASGYFIHNSRKTPVAWSVL